MTALNFGDEKLRVDTGTRAPARRRKRTTDYRLRGLDLDAPALADRPEERPRSHAGLRRRRRQLVMKTLVVGAVVVGVAAGLRGAVVRPYKVTTTSMVPTLEPDTDILVLTLDWLRGDIKAGDLIVFRQPEDIGCDAGTGDLVKRVIARPGDTIWSQDDQIFVNGRALDEPGWHNPPYGELAGSEIAPTTLAPDTYYVLGDNRTDVCDSRTFGAIPASLVVGEAVITVTRDGHPSIRGI